MRPGRIAPERRFALMGGRFWGSGSIHNKMRPIAFFFAQPR